MKRKKKEKEKKRPKGGSSESFHWQIAANCGEKC